MEKPCLDNPHLFPDDGVLTQALGAAHTVWMVLSRYLADEHPHITGEWRYYRDGKSWLFKVTKKKTTICWISVWPGMFKTTFYFPDRAEEPIRSSELDRQYIDAFVNGRHYGKTRGLTVEVRTKADLENVKRLIAIKELIR